MNADGAAHIQTWQKIYDLRLMQSTAKKFNNLWLKYLASLIGYLDELYSQIYP